MKQFSTLFSFFSRKMFPGALLGALLAGGIQWAAIARACRDIGELTLDLQNSWIAVGGVCGLCLLLVLSISRFDARKNQTIYTISRLPCSIRTAYVSAGVSALVCLLFFWGAQVLTLLGLLHWFLPEVSAQYLATLWYAHPYLHLMMPMVHVGGWICLALMLLTEAAIAMMMLRGSWRKETPLMERAAPMVLFWIVINNRGIDWAIFIDIVAVLYLLRTAYVLYMEEKE